MARMLKFVLTFGITVVVSYIVLRIGACLSFVEGYTVCKPDVIALSLILYFIVGLIRLCTLFDFLNTAYKYPNYISIFKSCWALDGWYSQKDKEAELAKLLETIAEQSTKLSDVEKSVSDIKEESKKDEEDK